MASKKTILVLGTIILDQLVATMVAVQAGTPLVVLARPIASLLAVIILSVLYMLVPKPGRVGIALALGGTISNLISWIRFHFVPDYIPLIFGIKTNIADLAITFGLVLVGAAILLQRKNHPEGGSFD